MLKHLMVLLTALIPASSWAGGTIAWEDVAPLLDSAPSLRSTVLENFDVRTVGLAFRIGSQVAPELGGARVAPYLFCARPKGQGGAAWTLALKIHATTTYTDAEGKIVSLGSNAVSFSETNPSIELVSAEDASCN